MQNGFVKLYRKLLDDPIFNRPNLLAVWIYCLLSASYQQKNILWNGKELTLQPGEFISGRLEGSKKCGLKPSTFYSQLKLLQKLGKIDTRSNNRFSLIRIVNWGEYQNSLASNSSTENNKPTSSQQPANTIKKYNNLKKVINSISTEEAASIIIFWNSKRLPAYNGDLNQLLNLLQQAPISLERIKQSICNLEEVLLDDSSFYDFQWLLPTFIKSKKGAINFYDPSVKSRYKKISNINTFKKKGAEEI